MVSKHSIYMRCERLASPCPNPKRDLKIRDPLEDYEELYRDYIGVNYCGFIWGI